jgi:hypothetical protein
MGSKRPDRRELLKSGAGLAGGLTLGAVAPASGQTPTSTSFISDRIPHGGRPSPDAFGLVFHVATPLQDSVGVITPSSLHDVATTRGSAYRELCACCVD